MKQLITSTKNFAIYFEVAQFGVLVHCDVYQWSKAVKVELLKHWEALTSLHTGPLYATENDEKHAKFLALFGFTRVGKVNTLFGCRPLWRT